MKSSFYPKKVNECLRDTQVEIMKGLFDGDDAVRMFFSVKETDLKKGILILFNTNLPSIMFGFVMKKIK